MLMMVKSNIMKFIRRFIVMCFCGACFAMIWVNYSKKDVGNTDVYFNSYLNGWRQGAYEVSTDTALIEFCFETDSLEMAYKLKYK